MLKHTVEQFFKAQLTEWALAKDNYKALKQVQVKTLDVGGCPYKVQFNPARITSVKANINPEFIHERKCFLCRENRPAAQRGIPFNEHYLILVNPFPIFPRHLTIPTIDAYAAIDRIPFWRYARPGATIRRLYHLL